MHAARYQVNIPVYISSGVQFCAWNATCIVHLIIRGGRNRINSRADQTTARGPCPARQRIFCGPPQPNDFIVIFLVWFPVTKISCLARFIFEWGYTVIQILPTHTDGCRSGPWLAYWPVSGTSYWRFFQTLILLFQVIFWVDVRPLTYVCKTETLAFSDCDYCYTLVL